MNTIDRFVVGVSTWAGLHDAPWHHEIVTYPCGCNYLPESKRVNVACEEHTAKSFKPCCEWGISVPCVCVQKWWCPVHGEHCFGTHD